MIDNVLQLELTVGLFISFILLIVFVWSAKGGNFDDQKKMMDGMLFDSPDDLRAAVERDNKQKEMRAKKAGKEAEKKVQKD